MQGILKTNDFGKKSDILIFLRLFGCLQQSTMDWPA